METYIAALDQGTTTSRAILFNSRGEIVSKAQYPFRQIFPQPGWVEHDPMEIWATTVRALSEAVDTAHIDPKAIAGVGITNQRETAILWDRRTGQPVYNAIVWQCRRTAEICDRLKADGLGETVTEKTGLLIDAYFSGTKLKWIMDNIPGVRQRAERGELCAGTVDSWLIWNLTGGKAHVTDYSNASRTMLFNIHTLQWDPALCAALDIPMDLLPEPKSNSEVYGHLASGLPGLEDLAGIPVCGSAGDQQSALFGQACFTPGQAKNTYGTGCFTLMNVGDTPVRSRSGLVTSVQETNSWDTANSSARDFAYSERQEDGYKVVEVIYRGKPYTYYIDSKNRLAVYEGPDGPARLFDYDEEGRVTQVVFRSNEVEAYTIAYGEVEVSNGISAPAVQLASHLHIAGKTITADGVKLLELFSADGKLVGSSRNGSISAPSSGIYIVVADGKRLKLRLCNLH